MREVKLTRGYVAIVDDEDFERVAAHKWYARVEHRADGSVRVYAARSVRLAGGRWAMQMMHRLILGAPDGVDTDHINGNGLDNRRVNLRLCTRAENVRNSRPRTGCSSALKGVSWHKASAKWMAYINMAGKRTYLGLFQSEQAAAEAYDLAAHELHGDFARTNTSREALWLRQQAAKPVPCKL